MVDSLPVISCRQEYPKIYYYENCMFLNLLYIYVIYGCPLTSFLLPLNRPLYQVPLRIYILPCNKRKNI